MHDQGTLLPTSGSALRADPGLSETVRRIGASHGMDYCDDAAVRRMLAEHEAAVRSQGRGPLTWFGALLFLAGVLWPIPMVLELWVPRPLDTPQGSAIAFGPSAPLLVLGFVLLLAAHRRRQRRLRHPVLAGYRLVLAAATAYGAAVTHVPAWLVGRPDYGGRETAPLPRFDAASVVRPAEEAPAVRGSEASVPRKPAEVSEYERIADHGGWHDELGLLLIIAGGLGIAWAYTQDEPAAYAAVVLVGLGVWAWLAGSRQGRRKEKLREHARSYVRQLVAAQSTGAVVPELSPPLRELMDTAGRR